MKICNRLPGFLALAVLMIDTFARAASTSTQPSSNLPYLVVSKSPNAVFLTAYNTLPNVSYQIQTNTDIANPGGWGVWITVTASNSVTPLASLTLDCKALFFQAVVLSPGVPNAPSNSQKPFYLGRLDLSAGANQNPSAAVSPSGTNAPVQPSSQWGRVINPDGDCNFFFGNDGVVISVPGSPHDLAAEIKRTNAPCLLQDVEGDFFIAVRTDGRFDPGGISTQPYRHAYNGAAVIVRLDPENVITLSRAVFQIPGKSPAFYANFELRSGGKLQRIGDTSDYRLPAKGPVYLRLERHGSQIKGAVSLDGSAWHSLGEKEIPSSWPAELSAGIAAISTSAAEFNPRFSDLKISK